MLSLKSLIPASLLALALPVAAPAHTASPDMNRVLPLFSAIMTPHAPAATLYRADFRRVPSLQPGIAIGPSIPHLRLRLHCAVAGTPVEFPDDLHIWSDYAVAAGTVANWEVTGTSWHGSVVLPAMQAGQYYFASGVLPGGWPAGADCTASTN
ncbi:MAG: hypothetical protein KDK12_15545 [Rhodobacteraceae bacterium]|nr:hypothetical protein [Paracoccaceae bacterium]